MTDVVKQKSYPSQQLRDSGGNVVDFQITDGATINPSTGGYTPPANKALSGFNICPLTAGVIVVRLKGQAATETFTIPEARISAMEGLWMEEKVAEIIAAGTTVTSCLVGWGN